MSQILSERWVKRKKDGRASPGYPQSREHIRLVEEEGYDLFTFPMEYSDENEESGVGPAKIGGFTPEVTKMRLVRVGQDWYAEDLTLVPKLPEEVVGDIEYREGALKEIQVNSYERNAAARAACLEHHGYQCSVCEFDFEKTYGELGKQFIHVHHRVQLKDIKKDYVVDPISDLVPVCPNCYAMIHRTDPPLEVDSLRKLIGSG